MGMMVAQFILFMVKINVDNITFKSGLKIL